MHLNIILELIKLASASNITTLIDCATNQNLFVFFLVIVTVRDKVGVQYVYFLKPVGRSMPYMMGGGGKIKHILPF